MSKDSKVEEVEQFVLACLERSSLVYVGIDPGVEGAIAFVCGPEYVVLDMPVYAVSRKRVVAISKKERLPGGPKTKTVKGKTSFYDLPKIVAIFKALRPIRKRVHVCVEVAQPMIKGKGGNNSRTAYLVGIGFGMWPLFLTQKGYAREEPQPAVWKKAMGLTGQDKERSRKKAQGLFPQAPLSAKAHHGRAEALLLAEYYRRLREGTSKSGVR